MIVNNITIKEQLIEAFEKEFGFIKDKFVLMDLLSDDSPMNYKTIEYLKLPSEEYNIIWHPGVYAFLGYNSLYRVGVSMRNSRKRVIEHLNVNTHKDGYSIWDINEASDKSILLFNVKDKADRHWLLALEAFIETRFNPKIKAGRIG